MPWYIWSTAFVYGALHICVYMKQYIFIWSTAFTNGTLFVVLTQTVPLQKGNILFFTGIAKVDMVYGVILKESLVVASYGQLSARGVVL